MHCTCDAHNVHAIKVKTCVHFDNDISGMVRTAISLHGPGAMLDLRRLLREDLRGRILLRDGLPPPAAVRHREAVLDLFLPLVSGIGIEAKRGSYIKRALLECLPTGDWQRSVA